MKITTLLFLYMLPLFLLITSAASAPYGPFSRKKTPPPPTGKHTFRTIFGNQTPPPATRKPERESHLIVSGTYI
ncbi:hypothetical protein F5887DRAFT_599091 [Amanita rubescens]|nr:hypothetical protein F5887DRAFT_599091 [Amanita rubescens]